MLLVKILAGNINIELLITLEEFSSHTIPYFDNSLFCRRQLSNEYEEYAAAIVATDHFKREEVVKYVLLFLSKTLNNFLRLPGLYASYKVTGTRVDRGIGVGWEIPIERTFVGKETATECIASHKYDD